MCTTIHEDRCMNYHVLEELLKKGDKEKAARIFYAILDIRCMNCVLLMFEHGLNFRLSSGRERRMIWE